VFVYPGLAPDIVILDPQVTRQTPPRLWFSTGMRALDHALETWCSTNPTSAFRCVLLLCRPAVDHLLAESVSIRQTTFRLAWTV